MFAFIPRLAARAIAPSLFLVLIAAGVSGQNGRTTGAPIAMLIRNRDWVNWQQTMYVEREMPEAASGSRRAEVTRPRPGHADLAGAIKYGHEDIRDVLERASARETASRVAASQGKLAAYSRRSGSLNLWRLSPLGG